MPYISPPEPKSPQSRSRTRKLAKWGTGLVVAFLAFAPPGTMIVIVLVVSKFLGASWWVVAGLLALAGAVSVFLIFRRRRKLGR